MANEPIVVDPSAWTGMSPTRWPSSAHHPFPAPLTAHHSGRIPLFAGLALLVFGLIQFDQVHAGNWRGSLFFGAIIAVAGGVWLLWVQHSARRGRQPVVALSAQGLAIPSWFDEVVPWSEVEEVVYTSDFATLGSGRTPGISIVVREEMRFKPTSQRMLRLPLPPWLDVRQKTLFDTMQAHRAHFGRGGKAAQPAFTAGSAQSG